MKRFFQLLSVVLLALILPAPAVLAQSGGGTQLFLPIVNRPPDGPQLKWAYSGCFSSWCQTGWYSSPAVVNIDGDAQAEIIASTYDLFALDGVSGAEQWRYEDSPGGRTWPGIALANLSGDSAPEIVIAQGGGYVTALTTGGAVLWQQQLGSSELRSLMVTDLDGNSSSPEVVAGAARSGSSNTWVLNANGVTRSGWPQVNSTASGYAAGIYNTNAAAGNLNGDAALELIIPTDVHYILGLKPDGSALAANSSVYSGRGVWGLVGVWENYSVEERGWGECSLGSGRGENYRPNFAGSPATLADVNGDGSLEIIVVGNVYDCSYDNYPSRYLGPFIFNADRTRFNSGGYDWRSTPVDTGAPLNEDYNEIENVQPNPVVVDLDGDGNKEIIYPSYDGRMHAFWLDKTEHGSWPFDVAMPQGIEYASEPVVADLDNNGLAEVIFATWPEKGSGRSGHLVVLSAGGSLLYRVELPAARGADWSGGLAAPTLANVDLDADLEVVVSTVHAGVAVYDLPGSAGARILWQTGRGSYSRQGLAE